MDYTKIIFVSKENVLLGPMAEWFADVIPEIAPVCKENALVISIAAGQTIANIEKLFGKTMKIVRTMPNTPALVLAGATGMCLSLIHI